MKILHQVGFRPGWNLETQFKNHIGDGFVFCAFSFPSEKIGTTIASYPGDRYMPLTSVDLQFYGNRNSNGFGEFSSYPFHPANYIGTDKTLTYGPETIIQGIEYQLRLGVDKVIIPSYFYDYDDVESNVKLLRAVNAVVKKTRRKDVAYYMTLPFGNATIRNLDLVQQLLYHATDKDICFDGYYIVCDPRPKYRRKISTDPLYYSNLHLVFKTLKQQGFKTMYGYANFDALVFASTADIDYVTIATFENLRSFRLERYVEKVQGGPSDGWYFSEHLLNFVRAQQVEFIRSRGCLNLIQNSNNIFSDVIVDSGYVWSSMKPDVHKNYLLSISGLFRELDALKTVKERTHLMHDKVVKARERYEELSGRGIALLDEEGDEHLRSWLEFLTPLM